MAPIQGLVPGILEHISYLSKNLIPIGFDLPELVELFRLHWSSSLQDHAEEHKPWSRPGVSEAIVKASVFDLSLAQLCHCLLYVIVRHPSISWWLLWLLYLNWGKYEIGSNARVLFSSDQIWNIIRIGRSLSVRWNSKTCEWSMRFMKVILLVLSLVRTLSLSEPLLRPGWRQDSWYKCTVYKCRGVE